MSILFHRSISYEDVFFSGSTAGRTVIDGDHALRVIPVYAAVTLIADALATLPMQLYRGNGPDRVQLPREGFLETPGAGLSWVDWMTQAMISLLLRGNAYGLVIRSGSRVEEIRWYHPDAVNVDESGSYPVYRIRGGEELLDIDHGGPILHVRAYVIPGKFKALSPIGLFRSQFEGVQAAADYGRDWFKGGGFPKSILKNVAATLDRKQARIARESFLDSLRKPGPVTIDKNWTWEKVSVSPQEAQFLETIRAGATQIATIYRIAPEDIGGETGKSMTYGNREQDQIRLNVRTLTPWAVRLETAFKKVLKPDQFVRFNLDATARPTLRDRVAAHNEALKGGQLTLDEVRALENRRPLTAEEIAFWAEHYQTMRTESQSTSITKEQQ